MNRASRQRRDRPQAGPPKARPVPSPHVRPMAVAARRPDSPPVAAPVIIERSAPIAQAVVEDYRAKAIPQQPSALLPMSAYERDRRAHAHDHAYAPEDLMTVAGIGYDFLMAGVLDEAQDIFEGLCAVDKKNGYFHLALGLVFDQRGELHKADEYYIKAAQLDPTDPRPDLNRAEIRMTLRRLDDAERYLMRGLEKARRTNEDDLVRKAETLLNHVRRRKAAQPGPRSQVPVRRVAR